MDTKVKHLKQQLAAAGAAVVLSTVALASSTYAWFIENTAVKATTSTISAKANNFVLQIATRSEGAQRGDNQSLVASSVGHRISPSSTNDLKNWFVSLNWGQDGKVHSYMQAAVNDSGMYTRDVTGTYTVTPERYAFIKSEYILYTVNKTGSCDVYLAANGSVPAIQVTAEGSPTSDIIPKSMRVGITIQDMVGTDPSGNENLVFVYAPYNETGIGNDFDAKSGWTYVKNETEVDHVSYPHIYGTTYTWTNGIDTRNYAATSIDGQNYSVPASNAATIASDVDYDGVLMRVYIWLEGTDEQCINNSNEEDLSTYNVTISLAGVAK